FHPSAATVAALTPLQLVIDKVKIDGKVSRNSLQKGDQGGTMGLAGRPKAQHALRIAEFSVTMAHDAFFVESCRQGSTGSDLPQRQGFRFPVQTPRLRARHSSADGFDRRWIAYRSHAHGLFYRRRPDTSDLQRTFSIWRSRIHRRSRFGLIGPRTRPRAL